MMRTWPPGGVVVQVTGFVAGVRWLGAGVAGEGAHSAIARFGVEQDAADVRLGGGGAAVQNKARVLQRTLDRAAERRHPGSLLDLVGSVLRRHLVGQPPVTRGP